jgi:O-antigen/teichoic acid export membrane protein
LTAVVLSVFLARASYAKARLEPGIELPAPRAWLDAARATPRAEVWSLARTGLLLSINKNFTALMPTVVPRLLLSHFAGSREVGYLNLAQNLMKIPLIGFQGVSRTILPVLGQLRGSGDVARLRRVLVKIMLLSGAVMIVLSSTAWIVLHSFIPFFYGEAARPAVKLLPWLFAAMVIAGFAVGSEGFFVIVKRLHVTVAISLVFATLAIPLGLWWVSVWGAQGAAAFVVFVHGGAAANIVYVFYYFKTTRARR